MKTYLVTGVSRGLGLAAATQLLSQGHSVHGTYNKNAEPANNLKKQYEHLSLHQIDLANTQEIESLVKELFGIQLDGIVNSAGLFTDIDFKNFDKNTFEETFRVNTFAPLYLVLGLQNSIKDGGSIVNISSTDSMVGSIVGIGYSASKAALENISKSLTNILAPRKIRSNSIALGWMGDGMQAPQEIIDLAADYNPLKRVASYDEIAKVVLFLLSDDASYINGDTIVVDGGDMTKNYLLHKESEI